MLKAHPIIVFICILLLFSCESDYDFQETPNYPNLLDFPTQEEFRNLFTQATQNRIQTMEIDAESGYYQFTSESGVKVILNTNCIVDSNNTPVTGTIDFSFIEIFDKGNMLVTNKPTMGRLPDEGKSIMQTGGEFFIGLSQNGEPLQYNCYYALSVPIALTGEPNSDMKLWKGSIDENANLTWENIEDPQNEGIFIEGGYYITYLNEMNWINLDVLYNAPEPKTTLYVEVPDGYDNTNSSVFISYDSYVENGLAYLDTYDVETGLFSEHYGQVPLGLECSIIFVSEVDGNYRYAIQAQTIEMDEIISITPSELQIATEDELVSIINSLP